MKKLIGVVLAGVVAFSWADSPAGWDQKECFGRRVYDREGDSVKSRTLNADVYGIYFSAHWCPHCRAFTPTLVDFYNEVKKAEGNFEIIFVSSDKSEGAMFEYMKETKMPWLAMEYKCSEANDLKERFEITSIPTLVVLDKDGNVITKGGRPDVTLAGVRAWSDWLQGKSPSVESASDNTRPSAWKGANALLDPNVSRKLNLTEDQKTQVKSIVRVTEKKWREEQSAGAEESELNRIRLDALGEALDLLTLEQKKILEEWDDSSQTSTSVSGK